MRVRAPLLLALALAAACGGDPAQEHPWLTDPGVAGHAPYLPLAGTPHEPGAAGGIAACEDCHPGESFRTFECTVCHYAARTGPAHGGLPGYPAGEVTSGECRGCHPDGLAAPVACGTCHAIPPPPPHGRSRSCGACHAGYAETSVNVADHRDGVVQVLATCTACHGDPARPADVAPAPPRDTAGGTATTAIGVGAHQRHLQGGTLRPALACTECHAVPASVAGHPDGTAAVAFGPLARSDGAAPAWSRASARCASTYCHGATLAGGTAREPVWTRVDGTQAECTSCHGLPPATAGHTGVAAGAPCGPCHPGYTATAVDPSRHVDGVSDASGSCTSCHGDPARPAATAPAPPRDSKGNVATTARGVGAHQAHLGGGALRAGGLACTECHAVPADMAGHPDGAADVVFGPLARGGGAVPSWSGATLSCSVYCHGATLSGGRDTTPTWTAVDGTQAACGTCHGVPPPAPHVQGTACGGCHGGYTATTVNLAAHVDGTIEATEMTCTACHGDPARTLVTGADPLARAAPPADTAGRSAATLRSVGAHLAHLNRGTGAIASPAACAECHAVPSSMTHADGAVRVAFGTRARTGGASPAWNGSTCAGTYCHGSHPNGTPSAPSWTSTARLACTACHPMPPATSAHALDHEKENGACSGCHKDTNAAGTAITRPALHLNGRVDGQCLDCHKTIPR